MAVTKVGLEAVFGTSSFVKGVDTYLNGLRQVSGQTTSVASIVQQGFATGIGIGVFNKVAEGIGNIVSAGFDLSVQMIKNVGELQMLSIALDTLAAKEIMAAGITTDAAEAYELGAAYADQMLEKIKEVSLESPFEYKDIVGTYRMAQAFGITSSLALDLTQALTNMSAGMGLSGQMMNRLIYNFGQMNRIGKISQRDVRDLAMAGMDLAEVLRTSLGLTIAETNEKLATNELRMQDVTQALIDYSNTFFSGAAEKASKTLPGLISSFHDLLFFASMDVWGPATEAVTKFLGKVFDKARELIDSGALKKIGAYLKVVADVAIDIAENALPFLNESLDDTKDEIDIFAKEGVPLLSESMDNLEDDMGVKAAKAFGWGANIILSFAAGFMEAISTVLVAAMNSLSEMLSFFLSGHSPPKVAPNIDDWGYSAMNEFVKGMTKADFSALDAIQGPLKDALGLAVDTGLISGQAGVDLFKSISKDIASFLTGTTSNLDAILSGLSSLGPMADEMGNLVKAQLAYAMATKEAKKAQDELTEAKNRSTKADDNLNIQIAKYNEMLRSGASKEALAKQRLLIEAAQKEQAESRKSVKTAEERAEKTKEGLDLLQEQFELQKALVLELTQLAKEVFQPAPVVEKIKGAGGGGGGKKGATGPAIVTEDMKKAMEAAGVPMQHLTGDLTTQAGLDAALAGNKFRKALEEAFGGLTEPINSLTTSVTNMDTAWKNLRKTLEPLTNQLFAKDGGMTDLGKTVGYIAIGFFTLTKIILPLAIGFQTLAPILGIVLGILTGFAVLVSPLLPLLAIVLLLVLTIKTFGKEAADAAVAITEGLDTIVGLVQEKWVDALSGAWEDITADWNQFKTDAKANWEEIKTDWNTNVEAVKTTVAGWGESLSTKWAEILTGIETFKTDVATWWEGYKTDWDTEIKNFNTLVDTWKTDAKKKWDEMLAGISGFFTDAGTAISDFVTVTVPGFLEDMKTAGSDLLQGFWDGLQSKWGEVIKWILQIAADLIKGIRGVFDEGSPSKVMFDIGANVTEGFKRGMKKNANELKRLGKDMYSPVIPRGVPATSSTINNSVVTNFKMNNNVSSRIDIAVLEMVVQRALQRAVRG